MPPADVPRVDAPPTVLVAITCIAAFLTAPDAVTRGDTSPAALAFIHCLDDHPAKYRCLFSVLLPSPSCHRSQHIC